MKKLVAIAAIFAVMIGAAIWEIVFTMNTYTEIYDGLLLLEESFSRHENVKNEESLAIMDDVYFKWEESKETLFCLGNHNVLRTVDEKIVSLKAMVDTDYTDDARIMLKVALSLVEAIRNDALPNSTNMF